MRSNLRIIPTIQTHSLLGRDSHLDCALVLLRNGLNSCSTFLKVPSGAERIQMVAFQFFKQGVIAVLSRGRRTKQRVALSRALRSSPMLPRAYAPGLNNSTPSGVGILPSARSRFRSVSAWLVRK
jgi:hypothetical protein